MLLIGDSTSPGDDNAPNGSDIMLDTADEDASVDGISEPSDSGFGPEPVRSPTKLLIPAGFR